MMVGALAHVNLCCGGLQTDTRCPWDLPLSLLVDTVVPFSAEGPLDPGALRAHTLWLVAHGVQGLLPGASEFLYVDAEEKERILEVVADAAAGRTLLASIWDPSPARSLRLGHHAADHGATAALLPPPLLLPVSEACLLTWYRAMSEALPIPVFAWHHPGFGNPLTPALCQTLAKETAIAGWVDSSGDLHRLRRVAQAARDRAWATFEDTLSPSEIGEAAALPGLCGGVSRLANAWPELVRRAWHDRAPDALEGLARRAALVRKAGGTAALRWALRMRGRLPLDATDATDATDAGELRRVPRGDF